MIETEIILTPEERRQLVATRETLVRIRDTQNWPASVTPALCGVEIMLESACPHNPEIHTLRDVHSGWEVTCHDCGATWLHIDR